VDRLFHFRACYRRWNVAHSHSISRLARTSPLN
jgi:hypothetical protein